MREGHKGASMLFVYFFFLKKAGANWQNFKLSHLSGDYLLMYALYFITHYMLAYLMYFIIKNEKDLLSMEGIDFFLKYLNYMKH